MPFLHDAHCLKLTQNVAFHDPPQFLNKLKMWQIVWKWLKMSHLILAFSTIFCTIKVICLVPLFDRKLQVLKNSPKLTNFWHFWWTFVHSKCKRSSLDTQFWIWDFFCDFQIWCCLMPLLRFFISLSRGKDDCCFKYAHTQLLARNIIIMMGNGGYAARGHKMDGKNAILNIKLDLFTYATKTY